MIKIQFTIYFLSLMLFNCGVKKQECKTFNVRAFTHYKFGIGLLNPEDEDYLLQIYDKPNGNVIGNLPPAEETGHIINIIDSEGMFFRIEFSFPEETSLKNKYGWVKKGTLGLVTRNYDGQAVKLYSQPSLNSSVSHTFEEVQIVKILEVCNDWAYVETFEDQKSSKGWLKPEMQCGNPLTTCP
ncbi:MAG: hypothetical protein AAGB24_12830 [Bacteroidota bacterium]